MDVSANGERFRSLFDTHFDEIRGYCLRRLSTSDANDAVSEVFMTAWRRIEDLPAQQGARLWLYGVARNVVRNRNRSLRRNVRLNARLNSLQPARPPGPETQVLIAAEHAAVVDALDTLPDDDREVVRLRLWEDMTLGDAAAILGISNKAASKRYARALQKIERTLAAAGAAPASVDQPVHGGER